MSDLYQIECPFCGSSILTSQTERSVKMCKNWMGKHLAHYHLEQTAYVIGQLAANKTKKPMLALPPASNIGVINAK